MISRDGARISHPLSAIGFQFITRINYNQDPILEMQNFRNLKVWHSSHQLVKEIYQCTQIFPKDESYGLKNQIRRACVSIPSNIAEGCGRGTDKDFARFIQIALGSASELEYQVFLAYELGYLSKPISLKLTKDIQSIKKMLTALRKRLLESDSKPD